MAVSEMVVIANECLPSFIISLCNALEIQHSYYAIITKLFTKRLSRRGGRAPVYHFDTIFNQLNTRFHHKKKIFYIFDHFLMKNVTGPFSSRVASQVLTNLLIPVFAILNDPLLKTG